MRKIIGFIKNSFKEVRFKVTWLTFKQLQNAVFWVFVGVFLWSGFLFCVNEVFGSVQASLYRWLIEKQS